MNVIVDCFLTSFMRSLICWMWTDIFNSTYSVKGCLLPVIIVYYKLLAFEFIFILLVVGFDWLCISETVF